MTAYFDDRGLAVQRLAHDYREGRIDEGKVAQALEKLELELVWDVTIASEAPGFPSHLQAEMNDLLVRCTIAAQTVNNESGGPNPETPEEHMRLLMNLIGDLHTIFHEVCRCHIEGFSDDPRAPLRVLFARSEERREQMVEAKRSGAV